MDSKKLNDWLQIIGLFGVIASLIFVGVQVRQTQVIAEGESAMYSIEVTVATRQMLIDNIDVWTKGCAGETMSAAEEAAFVQVLRGYLQANFFAWLTAKHNILDYNADDFVYILAATFHRYPELARAVEDWRVWAELGMSHNLEAGREINRAIEARMAELREIDPDPDYDVKYCGM